MALTWTPQRSVSEPKELVLELTASLWWLYSHKHLEGASVGVEKAFVGKISLFVVVY